MSQRQNFQSYCLGSIASETIFWILKYQVQKTVWLWSVYYTKPLILAMYVLLYNLMNTILYIQFCVCVWLLSAIWRWTVTADFFFPKHAHARTHARIHAHTHARTHAVYKQSVTLLSSTLRVTAAKLVSEDRPVVKAWWNPDPWYLKQ